MKHSFSLLLFLALGILACNNGETPAEDAAAEQTAGQLQQGSPAEETSKAEEKPVEFKFPELEGKRWKLSEYEYQGRTMEPLEGSKIHIRIQGDEITGNAGCNDIMGEVAVREDGTLSVGQLSKTKKLCQGMMTQEERFVSLLQGARSYSVNKIFLEVNSAEGKLSFQN